MLLFPDTDWLFFRVLAVSELYLVSVTVVAFLFAWQEPADRSSNCVGLLAHGNWKSKIISVTKISRLTSYRTSANLLIPNKSSWGCSCKAAVHQQSCSTKWVLATSPSHPLGSSTFHKWSVQKPPPMSMKTMCRLTHNPHHRKMVFGPPAAWHHSVFPLLDLCQMPALRTRGEGSAVAACAHSDIQYLIFH